MMTAQAGDEEPRFPSRDDCLESLRQQAGHYGDTWIISGNPYDQESALKVAEFCLLVEQPLTAAVTADGMLNLARRITALEARLGDR
jgi:hypothetical protein